MGLPKASRVVAAALLSLVAAATVLTIAAQPVAYGSIGVDVGWHRVAGHSELTVSSVESASPAARAGLTVGDRIVGFASFDDRVALTQEAPNGWLPLHRTVSFSARHATGAAFEVRLQGTPRYRGLPWLTRLRLALYLLGVLVVCALVWFRPSVVTWSFALFAILYLWPNFWYWQYIAARESPTLLFAVILVSYAASTIGSLGLITFATRFPEGAPLPPVYRTVERAGIVFLAVVGALSVQYQAAVAYGWPTLDYNTVSNAQNFVPALAAIALLGWTFVRSRGDERVPLVWAILGPSLCMLLEVADGWLLSIPSLPVAYSTAAGMLASIAPFSMMYAVLRYRVIDVGFTLNRSFAQAVAQPGSSRRDRDEASRLLVRRVALLFSADVPLFELYDRLATLLASFVDAQSILIATGSPASARLAYVYEDGKGVRPDDVPIAAQSVTGCVLRDGEPRLMRNAGEWPQESRIVRVRGRATRDPESAMFVPIEFGGTIVGVLSVQSLQPNAYDEEELDLLQACAIYLGVRLQAGGLPARIRDAASFDDAFAREWSRAAHARSHLGVLLFEIDLFESFNDIYGRAAGDTCVRQVAEAVASSLRPDALFVGRCDGDVFAAILEADGAHIERCVEAARRSVRELEIPHQGSSLGSVTLSAGASSCVPDDRLDPRALLEQARTRLESAKLQREARPQVVARHNLPEPTSTFVGRAAEIARLEEALNAERLVTVVGPGGAGKSRIALEIARRCVDRYTDGVWLVDVGGVKSGEAVRHAAAAALGVGVRDDDADRFVEALRGKHALVVLDNCEHLLSACSQVARDLLCAGGVDVLATSREPLALPDESVFRMPPLESGDAVRLFLDRTHRTHATASDRGAIETIVTRLDGLPMAIELAAARGTGVGPRELLSALDDALTDGSLRALFDWSYRLLTPAEQNVLRHLSIFSGGWTSDAAIALCSERDVGAATIANALESLVAKSLVLRGERDGLVRFQFLETTRQYARQALERHGEDAAATVRHLQWATAHAWEVSRLRAELPFAHWMALQTAEAENYRAALRVAFGEMRDDAAAATILRSLCGLLIEWQTFAEFEPALRERLASGSLTDAQEAAFWEALGELVRLRRPAESRDAAQRAADRFAHCGDAYGESYAVWLLAAAELRVNGAIERSTQARMEAALAAARRSGDRHLIAGLLRHLARTNSESGRAEKARAALREAAEIVDPTDTVLLTAVMGSSADEELRHGNVDAAIALWNQAASLAEESRLSYAALCFANIAMSEAMRGNLALARLMLMRGLNGVRTARHAFGMARPFDYFAQLLKESGDLPRAARLAGFGAAFFDGEPQRPPADQRRFDDMIAELRRTLGAEAFEREWNQGRALEVDGAVAQLMMG